MIRGWMRFQFLVGRLKITQPSIGTLLTSLFQFLVGRLKMQVCFACTDVAEEVSIPRR